MSLVVVSSVSLARRERPTFHLSRNRGDRPSCGASLWSGFDPAAGDTGPTSTWVAVERRRAEYIGVRCRACFGADVRQPSR